MSGLSEAVDLVARYTRAERVYVRGTGRGDNRSYKPRVLPFGVRSAIVGVRWRNWGSRLAIGRGRVEYNNCEPSCAEARPSAYPVRVMLSRRRDCATGVQYRTLRFRYSTSRRPPGFPRTYREELPC